MGTEASDIEVATVLGLASLCGSSSTLLTVSDGMGRMVGGIETTVVALFGLPRPRFTGGVGLLHGICSSLDGGRDRSLDGSSDNSLEGCGGDSLEYNGSSLDGSDS